MTFKDKLKAEAESLGIALEPTALSRFEAYYSMLIDYNTRMNLTAITEEEEVITKHFCDSLCILAHFSLPEGARVIDVGTGAGFPGIPLLIARPDIKLTLLDGLKKRLDFLSAVCAEINLSAEILHCRAEEGSVRPEYREAFDLATSRAVARQSTLCEYCIPYVKVGGKFIAMKGPAAKEEMAEAKNAVKLLGGKVERIEEYTLRDNSRRALISIEKISPTPKKYPRHNSKIKSKPL